MLPALDKMVHACTPVVLTVKDDRNHFNINTMDVYVLITIGCLRLGKLISIPPNQHTQEMSWVKAEFNRKSSAELQDVVGNTRQTRRVCTLI